MKTVDVIIPSNGTELFSRVITEASIKSLRSSLKENSTYQFNVVVVEQNNSITHPYADKVIYYDFPFNYNRVLNLGISETNGEYVLLCNNDLIYHTGFFDEMLRVFRIGYLSLSPTNPLRSVPSVKPIIEGYGINHDLMGWCIATKRELFKRIGKIDEAVSFWYSDNLYADQLKYYHIEHARVAMSFVSHIGSGSTSLRKLSREEKEELTTLQKKIYEDARKKYVQ